jgi:hypothetical protein
VEPHHGHSKVALLEAPLRPPPPGDLRFCPVQLNKLLCRMLCCASRVSAPLGSPPCLSDTVEPLHSHWSAHTGCELRATLRISSGKPQLQVSQLRAPIMRLLVLLLLAVCQSALGKYSLGIKDSIMVSLLRKIVH